MHSERLSSPLDPGEIIEASPELVDVSDAISVSAADEVQHGGARIHYPLNMSPEEYEYFRSL